MPDGPSGFFGQPWVFVLFLILILLLLSNN